MVGAFLLVGLIVSSLVMVQVRFVPVWEEDAEAARADKVQGQFAAIQSEAQRQAANRTTSAVSLPVDLGEQGASRLFKPVQLPSRLAFEPGTADATVAADKMLIQVRSGVSLGGINETWTEVFTNDAITDVLDLLHLRFRVADPEAGQDGDAVALVVTDARGDFAGSLTVYVNRYPSGYAINTETVDARGVVLYDEGESRFQQDQPPYYWVNALQEDYLFGAIMAAAAKPVTLSISEDGLHGEYAIQYVQDTASGPVVVGSTGVEVNGYNETFPGGTLSHLSRNQHYPSQKLILEHGATILEQDDGALFLVQPPLSVERRDNLTLVALTLPSLQGEARAVDRTGTATVQMRGATPLSFTALAPHVRINLTTSHPGLWTAHWNTTLAAAGLDAAEGHYTVTSGAGWARLVLYGLTADPGSTQYDVTLVLSQSVIRTELPL